MITHLFFDLGSTLIDETACVNARIEAVLRQPGAPSREEFLKKVEELSAVSWTFVKDAAAFYGISVPGWDSSLETVYPEAFEVLKTLSEKYTLGVIANQSAGAERRMTERGIREFFDVIVLSAEEGVAKPDHEIFRRALTRAGCAAENAAMIGDRDDNDIIPAKELGMKTVRLRRERFGGAPSMQGAPAADYTVGSLRELLDIF